MRRSRITVHNLNKRRRINENFTKKIALEILRALKKPLDTELEVIFLDAAAMRRFNRQYTGRGHATDVLSFSLDRSEFRSRPFLGEIIISSDTAFKNAKIFGTDYAEELVRYIIHGVLHFFGYEDQTQADRLKMSSKENAILERICTKENLSKVLMRR